MIINNKILLTFVFMILICSTIALASSFVQYTPSPTTTAIDSIFSLNNGKGFAITYLGANYLLYNGSSWNEITAPNSSLTKGYSFSHARKTGNYVYIMYTAEGGSGWVDNVSVVRFDSSSTTYSLSQELNNFDFSNICNGWHCQESTGNCYFSTISGAPSYFAQLWKFVDSNSPTLDLIFNVSSSSREGCQLLESTGTDFYFMGQTDEFQPYLWNGVSLVLLSTLTGRFKNNPAFKHIDLSVNEKIFCRNLIGSSAYPYGLIYYNISTNTYKDFYSTESIYKATEKSFGFCELVDGDKLIVSANLGSTAEIFEHSLYSTNTKSLINISNPLSSAPSGRVADFDYNSNTGLGWYGGGGGYIYLYNNSVSHITPDVYGVFASANPNPTKFGDATTFNVVVNDPNPLTSTVGVDIHDSLGSLYFWEWLGVSSGESLSYKIDGFLWDNFPVGNYTVYVTASNTYGVSDAKSFIWRVYSPELEEIKVYEVSEIKNVSSDFSGITAVDSVGGSKSFFLGLYNGVLNIISASHSTGRMTIDNLSFPKDTFGLNTLNAIKILSDNAYIGTNNELYIFNGTILGGASDLNKSSNVGIAGLFNDHIKDVHGEGADGLWVCNIALTTENAHYYNFSAGSFDFSISENTNPCNSIYVKDGIVAIHKGSSVLLFNESELISSSGADGLKNTITISSNTFNGKDSISFSNNYMFIISSRQGIRKYDLTNISDPVLLGECRSDRRIISIEALTDDYVILGSRNDDLTGGKLSVCDYDNNNSYLHSGGYYVENNLHLFSNNEIPHEISKNSEHLFSIAFGNGFGFYELSTYESITEINSRPVINSISYTPSDSICINESVSFIINASDIDGDTLYYDVSCDITSQNTMKNRYLSNEFICDFSSAGSKNVMFFVADDTYSSSPTSTSRTLTVSDCVASPKILVEVQDYNTGMRISGVEVNLDNTETKYTDAYGKTFFYVDDYTTNHVLKMKKDGYFSEDFSDVKASYYNTIYFLKPTTLSGTVLIIITQNSSGDSVGGSLVSVTNTITGQNQFAFTDSNGRAIFYNSITGEKLVISANNEALGYKTTGLWYASIRSGEQKTVIINLSSEWIFGQGDWIVTDRYCKDLITGVWLCGNLTVSGVGNLCNVDADCISGRCGIGKECSAFNYTICDNKMINRGNTCVFTATIEGALKQITALLLGAFIFVIVIVILLVFYLLLTKKK